jgi:hypothetical protein
MRQNASIDICQCKHKRSKHHAMIKDLAKPDQIHWFACWVYGCFCGEFRDLLPASTPYATRFKTEVIEQTLQQMGSGFTSLGKALGLCDSNERLKTLAC